MGYKKNDPCLDKAFGDERLFVIMTRDMTAPSVVLEWIKQNISIQPEEKLREAFECALEMNKRRLEISLRKGKEAEGWIYVSKETPPFNSDCEVLFIDGTTGNLIYWSDEEGFDAQSEPHHIEVVAWKNPKRAI